MTATAFPTTLPRPQARGYGYAVVPPVRETPGDRGPGRARRLSLRPTVLSTLTWTFTNAQFAIWDEFWRVTLRRGSLPFSIALPNGFDDAAQDVQARAVYAVDDAGGQWAVSLPVELLNPPRMSAGDIPLLADASLADALHTIVHHTIPGSLP